jgi:hypothetical protein
MRIENITGKKTNLCALIFLSVCVCVGLPGRLVPSSCPVVLSRRSSQSGVGSSKSGVGSSKSEVGSFMRSLVCG